MRQKKAINFILITILIVAVIFILLANFGVDVFNSPRGGEIYINSFNEIEPGVILNGATPDIISSIAYSTNLVESDVKNIEFYINGELQNIRPEFFEEIEQLDTGFYLNPKNLLDGKNEFYLKIFLKNRKILENKEIYIYDLQGPEIISMETAKDKSYQIIEVSDTEEIKILYYESGESLEIETLIELGSGKYKILFGGLNPDNFVYYLFDEHENTGIYSTKSLNGGRSNVKNLVSAMNFPKELNQELITAGDVASVSDDETLNLLLSPPSCEYRAKFVSFYLYDDSPGNEEFNRGLANLNQVYGQYLTSINRFNQQLLPTDYAPITPALLNSGDYYLIGIEQDNLGHFGGVLEREHYYDEQYDPEHVFPIYTGGVRIVNYAALFSLIDSFNGGSLTPPTDGTVGGIAQAVVNPDDKELILIADSMVGGDGMTAAKRGMMILTDTVPRVVGHEMGHSLGLGHWDVTGVDSSNYNLMDVPTMTAGLEWNQLERISAALCGDPANKISLEGRYGKFGVNMAYENGNPNDCGNGLIAKNGNNDWEWCEDSFYEVPSIWQSDEICPDMYSRPIVKYPSVYACDNSCLCSGGGTGSEPPAPGTGDSVPPGGGTGGGGGPSTPGPKPKVCEDCKPKLTIAGNAGGFGIHAEFTCPDKDCPNLVGPNGGIIEQVCKPDTSQLSPGQAPYSCKCEGVGEETIKDASDTSFEEL